MIGTAIAFDWPLRLRAVRETHHTLTAGQGDDEHRHILDALLERDAQRAQELCHAHALSGSERYPRQAESHWPDIAEDTPRGS